MHCTEYSHVQYTSTAVPHAHVMEVEGPRDGDVHDKHILLSCVSVDVLVCAGWRGDLCVHEGPRVRMRVRVSAGCWMQA